MSTIQIFLWFNTEGEDAAKFYTSLFKNSKIAGQAPYGKNSAEATGQKVGSTMTVEFELAGQKFLALNAGPHFKFNPSISFMVACETEKEIDELWSKLSKTVRMELKNYPFAEKYGWCEDKFGVNWQLILGSRRQKISPALLFANKKFGKAEEAIRFYTSQFPHSEIETIAKDEKSGAVLHGSFTVAGQSFVIMEGPLEHQFDFDESVSFMILCDSQEEIDNMWKKLSAVPESEQCGWLKDKFGVSWQIGHKGMGKALIESDSATRQKLMDVVMKMKKPDIKKLEAAYGKPL